MAENQWDAKFRSMMRPEKDAALLVAEFDKFYEAADKALKVQLDSWLDAIKEHFKDTTANVGDGSAKFLLWQTLSFLNLDAMDKCEAVTRGETMRGYRERGEFEVRQKRDRMR